MPAGANPFRDSRIPSETAEQSPTIQEIVMRFPSLLMIVLAASFLLTGTTRAQLSAVPAAPKIGEQAPDFTLKDFSGKTFTLSPLMKKNGVLLWFTNLCSGCQEQVPTVERLKALYAKKNIGVVAVSVLGKERKHVEDVMARNKVTFPFLYDPSGEATRLYSGQYVQGTCPLKNIFVIEKGGKILFSRHLPGTSERELLAQLDKAAK
jgi:peroxiredoxin